MPHPRASMAEVDGVAICSWFDPKHAMPTGSPRTNAGRRRRLIKKRHVETARSSPNCSNSSSGTDWHEFRANLFDDARRGTQSAIWTERPVLKRTRVRICTDLHGLREPRDTQRHTEQTRLACAMLVACLARARSSSNESMRKLEIAKEDTRFVWRF